MVEKYMKPEEVAEMLGLARNKVLELARKGEIPHTKLNKRVILFTTTDIEEFQKRAKK
jgi:excisionase family DNA binding protein